MYASSRSYFLSESLKEPRFQRLYKLYSNDMFDIYLYFYQAVLPTFTNFNLFLQRDAPQIYLLYDQMHVLLRKLLSKFVKSTVIAASEDITEVEYLSTENQKENHQLFIGIITKGMSSKKLDDGDLALEQIQKFYRGVRSFYEKAVRYILKWFPFSEDLIRCSQFVDFYKRHESEFEMVEFWVELYSNIFTDMQTPQAVDALAAEFADYQSLSETNIPKSVWDKA